METEGKKFDDSKLPWHLMPWDALEEVAAVLGTGAVKYADRNWEEGLKYSQVYRALINHAQSFWRGEEADAETKLHHTAHLCCNALFLLAYQIRNLHNKETNRAVDDRPKTEVNGVLTTRVLQKAVEEFAERHKE